LTTVLNRTVVDNLIRLLPVINEICPPDGLYTVYPQTQPFMHERLIASLVANGMSHSAGAIEIWRRSDSDQAWHNGDYKQYDPPGIILTVHRSLPDYAWNLGGSTVKIAIAILITYCVYISTYVLYTFFTSYSSTTWSSISVIVALALNSTPTKALKHNSAGNRQIGTFRNLVSVRNVESNGHLELIFQAKGESNLPYKRVVPGRASEDPSWWKFFLETLYIILYNILYGA
jgi:hypothetical protein